MIDKRFGIVRVWWYWPLWREQKLYWYRAGQQVEFRLGPLGIEFGWKGYPCRVCGGRDDVLTWDDENPGATICYECCPHEDFYYDRWDGYVCKECGGISMEREYESY